MLASSFKHLRAFKYVYIYSLKLYMNTKSMHILGISTVALLNPLSASALLAMMDPKFYQLKWIIILLMSLIRTCLYPQSQRRWRRQARWQKKWTSSLMIAPMLSLLVPRPNKRHSYLYPLKKKKNELTILQKWKKKKITIQILLLSNKISLLLLLKIKIIITYTFCSCKNLEYLVIVINHYLPLAVGLTDIM